MFSLLLHFEVLLNRVSFDDPFGFHVDISISRIRLKIAFESVLRFKLLKYAPYNMVHILQVKVDGNSAKSGLRQYKINGLKLPNGRKGNPQFN